MFTRTSKHLFAKPPLLAVALAAALLIGCGGSSDDSGDDDGLNSRSSYLIPTSNAGTISGLGSIVVNGVRYETLGASVVDADDGSALVSPLGLGMTVDIESSTSSARTASVIRVHQGLAGGTSAVDSTAKTLTVAGLPVTTDASTYIVGTTGAVASFADLVNAQVEVFGLPQADGTFKATRIALTASAPNVRLLGVVSQWDSLGKRFSLGSGTHVVTVSYTTLNAPTGLSNGAVVSVQTSTTSSANSYTATRVTVRSTSAATYTASTSRYQGTSGLRNEVNELYGMVSGLTQATSGCTLLVQGVPASLSSNTLCAALRDGDYVEVKGVLSNGVLAAYRLEFKTTGGNRDLANTHYADDLDDSDHDNLRYTRQDTSTSYDDSQDDTHSSTVGGTYELYGVLSNCTSTTCTLTTNGVALTADISTTVWEHGIVVTSGRIEAKGYMTSATTFKVLKMEAKR